MFGTSSQTRLELIKQKISKSSKALGIIYILIGLSGFISYLILYVGFSLFLQFLDPDFLFGSLFLLYIFPIVLVILRYIYFFKLAGGFSDLSYVLMSYYQFPINSAKDVSKFIKMSMVTEIIYIFASPFLFFILLALPPILSIAILFLPFFFLAYGFKALSPTFEELKKLNLYFDNFSNWLLYSRYLVGVSTFSSLYGSIRLINAIFEGILTGSVNLSFLFWFLIAAIAALLGYICFVGGFFGLSSNIMKIGLTKIEYTSQSYPVQEQISSPVLGQSIKEEVVYADEETRIAFKENTEPENPNSMVLEIRDAQIDRINPFNSNRTTIVKQPVIKYCPECGTKNDIDSRFCSNCGVRFNHF